MTCKDCIHYEACKTMVEATLFVVAIDETYNAAEDCPNFADKSLYIKLPCKIGDTLFDISAFVYGEERPMMYEDKARYIELQKDRESGELIFCIEGTNYRHDDFGKTVFLTREAAEAALKEREK